jgi:hypothetical protein
MSTFFGVVSIENLNFLLKVSFCQNLLDITVGGILRTPGQRPINNNFLLFKTGRARWKENRKKSSLGMHKRKKTDRFYWENIEKFTRRGTGHLILHSF